MSIFSIIVFLVTWRIIFGGFYRPPFHRHAAVNLPKDPLERAKALLETVPLIDGVSFLAAYLGHPALISWSV